MSSTPKTTIDPNTLALHETAQVATHYGHTLWTTKVNGGNLYQWDNGPPAFVRGARNSSLPIGRRRNGMPWKSSMKLSRGMGYDLRQYYSMHDYHAGWPSVYS